MATSPSIGIFMLLLCTLLVSCAPATEKQDDVPQAQIANPAATYCNEQGGQYTIVTADDGSQSGACTLSDGTVCNGWEYFRGECP